MLRRLLPLAGGIALGGLLSLTAVARRRLVRPTTTGPRVVILGAGFAGITAARALGPRLAGRAQVTLVDRHNYHLFTPMLFQVAASGVDPYNIAIPTRQLASRRGVAFRLGTITGIDLAARRVELADGALDYDYLVIALGSTTDFFGNASAERHALPLKRLEDGIAVRHRVIDALERAVKASDEADRRALLTFVVVGGGATGVETAAALADLFDNAIPTEYPSLDRREARVIVLQSRERLLPEWSETMSATALRYLRDQDVEVWLKTRAKQVDPNRVITESGREIPTRTAIWTTGVRSPDVIAALGLPRGRGGGLLVDDCCRVEGYPGVFAVGDNAYVIEPKAKTAVPMLAAAAVQAGEAVAENVARAIERQPLVPFRYRSLGSAISFGRRSGALEIGGVVVDGFLGGLAWRGIHVARIASTRDQIGTALDWASDYFGTQDTIRIELELSQKAIEQKLSDGPGVGKALDRRAAGQ